jgi:hypothetical protein
MVIQEESAFTRYNKAARNWWNNWNPILAKTIWNGMRCPDPDWKGATSLIILLESRPLIAKGVETQLDGQLQLRGRTNSSSRSTWEAPHEDWIMKIRIGTRGSGLVSTKRARKYVTWARWDHLSTAEKEPLVSQLYLRKIGKIFCSEQLSLLKWKPESEKTLN